MCATWTDIERRAPRNAVSGLIAIFAASWNILETVPEKRQVVE